MKNLASCLALVGLTSCASLMTGSTDSVLIQSVPSGAEFSTNLGHEGVTPFLLAIPDDRDLEVRYQLAGYRDGLAVAEAKPSAWVMGNVLFGGLIGIGIDILSGHMNIHDDAVTCVLEPLGIEQPESEVVAAP